MSTQTWLKIWLLLALSIAVGLTLYWFGWKLLICILAFQFSDNISKKISGGIR